jgi:hypothetical protein
METHFPNWSIWLSFLGPSHASLQRLANLDLRISYFVGWVRLENGSLEDEVMCRFVSLQVLKLPRSVWQITDDGLNRMVSLTSLDFDNCNGNFTHEGIRPLTNLTSLVLNDSRHTNEAITSLPKLAILDLSSYSWQPSPISFDGISLMTNLTSLSLNNNHGILRRGIKLLTNLTHLEIAGTNMSIFRLTKLCNLRTLNLMQQQFCASE